MDPEFRAFVDSIAPECAGEKRGNLTLIASRRKNSAVVQHLKEAWTLFADVINEIGPFACELRPIRRVKDACAKLNRDAIGHHGLI